MGHPDRPLTHDENQNTLRHFAYTEFPSMDRDQLRWLCQDIEDRLWLILHDLDQFH